MSANGYKMLLNLFPKLETLDLSSCNSQTFIDFLGLFCPNLKTLYINYAQLTNESLLKIAQMLPKLRVIFADCNQITNEGVLEFLQLHSNIVFMSFKNNSITHEMGTKIQVNMAFNGGYMEF